jgi:anaerobic ribonucleoside-triphosphate reductase activating protein
MADALRLHAFEPVSCAHGPGARAVIWTQGCTLGCPGCFHPQTHEGASGVLADVDALFERIHALGDAIEGVTVSGGEPLQQRRALLPLLQRIKRETSLSALLLTGFDLADVFRMREARELLVCVDVLVAGRYEASRQLARGLRGSANQAVHRLTNRYSAAQLEHVPPASTRHPRQLQSAAWDPYQEATR